MIFATPKSTARAPGWASSATSPYASRWAAPLGCPGKKRWAVLLLTQCPGRRHTGEKASTPGSAASHKGMLSRLLQRSFGPSFAGRNPKTSSRQELNSSLYPDLAAHWIHRLAAVSHRHSLLRLGCESGLADDFLHGMCRKLWSFHQSSDKQGTRTRQWPSPTSGGM